MKVKTALAIGGSDPSGAAGIQADLKVFAACGVYGMSVITAITSQNSCGVREVMPLPAESVASQYQAILEDIPADSTKIGMLATVEIITILSELLSEKTIRNVVLDPILRSSSGAMLIDVAAINVLVKTLFPLIDLVTPNIDEAAHLAGMEIACDDDMKKAARIIFDMGPKNVLVKGGHLKGRAVDILFDGRVFESFDGERLPGGEFRGTGCALSSAIAAALAQGRDLKSAVKEGKAFVRESIKTGFRDLGKGMGILNHHHSLK